MGDDLPNRQSIRLVGFDYTNSGYYFVTICSHDRENLFGKIVDGKMVLNKCGEIVSGLINQTPTADVFMVMPNHVHVMIRVGVSFMKPEYKKGNTKENLGEIVRKIKAKTSYLIHKTGMNKMVWQRNYYE